MLVETIGILPDVRIAALIGSTRLSSTITPANCEGSRMASTNASQNLRMLAHDELIVGVMLPGDIRNRNGHTLIAGQQVLTADHLAALEKSGQVLLFAGDDWPAPEPEPPAAEEDLQDEPDLMDALRQRCGKPTSSSPRRHERHDWAVLLKLSIEEKSEEGTRRRDLTVTTCDLSASGLAFYHRHYLHPGSIIHTRFDSLPGKPCVKAVVRHCTHLEANKHRIGAEILAVRRLKS